MTQEHPAPGSALSADSAPAAVIDGRGRQAIRMWTLRRAEANLPDMGSWDGPLVALAIALMWDKGIEAETRRFRQARADVLDDSQITMDLRIGHDCVAEFTDRGESQRGSGAGGPALDAGSAGSTWDLFLSLVGHRTAGSLPADLPLRSHLPFPRAVTA